jgi:hypothetical protein
MPHFKPLYVCVRKRASGYTGYTQAYFGWVFNFFTLKLPFMGRSAKGIMGDVSGKVGTVVGAKWRGKSYLRSKPDTKKNAKRSNTQLAQQAKFSVARTFLHGMKDLLEIDYKTTAIGLTDQNKALAHMLKNAIGGTYPDYSIIYNKVMVSEGNLHNAFDAKAAATKDAVQFTWTNNSDISNGKETDQILMVAYCPEFNCTVYRIGAARSTGTDTLQMPGLGGKLVHTWMSFISTDGGNIASSRYTGEITVS